MSIGLKKKSDQTGRLFLIDAFQEQQAVLSKQIEFASKSITHHGKRGEITEKYFIDVLRHYLPNRYCIDSAIVIDSLGHTSDQIDVVIYDKLYTPTLLDQHDHKYVPAEAVYAVFEVKPSINAEYLKYASKKAVSVRRLKRTSVEFQTAKGPGSNAVKYVLAGIVGNDCGWKTGFKKSFGTVHSSLRRQGHVDCGIALKAGGFDCFQKLEKYLKKNNAVKTKNNTPIVESFFSPRTFSQKNCLVVFLFRLLKYLQFIGTVPAPDWDKYASNFK